MSITPIDIEYFYKEVEEANSVWTLHKDQRVLTILADDGSQAMPFWSTRERAMGFIANREDFEEFFPLEISLHLFLQVWLSDLNRKKINIGVNWSGKTNIGCEASAKEIISRLESGSRSSA